MSSMNQREDEILKERMLEVPMSQQTPENLKSKLIDSALDAQTSHRPVRRPGFVFALTAIIAGVAIGSYLLAPSPAVSKTWQMVKDAVRGVSTMSLSVREIKNGKTEEVVNVGIANNQIMVHAEDGTKVLVQNGEIKVYEPEENQIIHIKNAGEMIGMAETFMKEAMGEVFNTMNVKTLLAELEKEHGKENIKISPIRIQDGRKVYDINMLNPKTKDAARIQVDAATDLPTYIYVSERGDGELSDTEINIRYNDRLDMKMNFPKDAKVQEIDLSKIGEMMGKGFNEEMAKEFKNEFSKGMKGAGKSGSDNPKPEIKIDLK